MNNPSSYGDVEYQGDLRALKAIEEWRILAASEIDDVCAFRDGRGMCGPGNADRLYALTDRLFNLALSEFPTLEFQPVRRVYEIVRAFRDDPTGAATPSCGDVTAITDSAMTAVNAMLHVILARTKEFEQPGHGRIQADAERSPKKTIHDAPPDRRCAPTHADDFTSVDWFGTRYEFTKGLQAEAVRALWKAWEDGSHSLKQETLGERTGSAAEPFRLRDVFRRKGKMHDAWGTMIVEASKGVFRLALPKDL